MSKVDISSEAVERLAKSLSGPSPRNCLERADAAATLRAQAARIKELEARCRIVSRGLDALIEGDTND
ncbi:hypothetical protein [Sulfitobacter sp. 1A13679]|uniref:hypothetical protein n=1 Tax=Sulfitobacter sp. 1A13679 TaxID=3368597 RepID=UPI00374694A4